MSEPDYEDTNSLEAHQEDIEKGKVVVLLDKYSENRATTEPNTIGPDGVRNPETEQKAESLGERPMINDHELTTDELEDYEKKY